MRERAQRRIASRGHTLCKCAVFLRVSCRISMVSGPVEQRHIEQLEETLSRCMASIANLTNVCRSLQARISSLEDMVESEATTPSSLPGLETAASAERPGVGPFQHAPSPHESMGRTCAICARNQHSMETFTQAAHHSLSDSDGSPARSAISRSFDTPVRGTCPWSTPSTSSPCTQSSTLNARRACPALPGPIVHSGRIAGAILPQCGFPDAVEREANWQLMDIARFTTALPETSPLLATPPDHSENVGSRSAANDERIRAARRVFIDETSHQSLANIKA